jgi:hypothetical protein
VAEAIDETENFSKLVKHQRCQVAMEKEMESISKNKTWDLMDLLVGKKLILEKWVYKLKQGLDNVQTYKARLVAKRNE